MDAIQTAMVYRAQSALHMLTAEAQTDRTRAKAFQEIAFEMLGSQRTSGAVLALQNSANPLVQKAVAHALGDDVWQGADARALAQSYIASIAELSLLDQIKKYCRVLPADGTRVVVAAASVADVAAEGAPKPVRQQGLNLDDADPIKCAAIVVLSRELAGSIEGAQLFRDELEASVLRACNRSVLSAMAVGAVAVSATGDGPLADLRAGLQAAGPSEGYVIAAPAGAVAVLATTVENRGGMSVRGGTFVPGIEIVAIDDLTAMTVIPASRVALADHGLQIHSASAATVDMRASPTADAVLTSLWQDGLLGLLAERSWRLAAGGATCAIVEV